MDSIEARLEAVIDIARRNGGVRAKSGGPGDVPGPSRAELRHEAEEAWAHIKSRLYDEVVRWNAKLAPTGFVLEFAVERGEESSPVIEKVSIMLIPPRGPASHPLRFAPVATIPGHISYNGPNRRGVSGAQGYLGLSKPDPDQAIEVLMGYLEFVVSTTRQA